MFNALNSISDLYYLALLFFVIFLVLRLLFCKSKKMIFAYHFILFITLFIASIGAGSVKNDGYRRLEKFIELEKNNQLELAKNNPQNYESMLQIDFTHFNNSNDFSNYLKNYDHKIDIAEAIFVSWLFVFLTEISMLIVKFINYISSAIIRIKYKIKTKKNS
jgi:hypothetical protein